MRNNLLLLCLFFLTFVAYSQQKQTISGYVEDANTGEKLIGASIYDIKTQKGTTTNIYGFYSLTLPTDSINVVVRYIGYQTSFNKINLQKDFILNVSLKPGNELKEIEIVEFKQEKIENRSRMSTIEIPIQQIKKIPALLGEVDVLKVIQLLPGIQSGGEGSSGFYVRGGGPDQNLILLDGVPVYNASHLFGFFSVFNADAIKNVEIVKGGFPARYGGRLSSVLEINMKEGNNKKIHGEGSIGIISSKLTLEGPIIKEKTSFIISGRRTYIDYLMRPLIKKQTNGDVGGYYFYDLNGKVNHKISEKDHIYLSVYTGKDKFYARTEDKNSNSGNTVIQKSNFGIGWGNSTTALRWNHVFNGKLFSNTTLTYSKYNFDTEIKYSSEDKKGIVENNQSFQLNYLSGINDVGGKIDFDYFPIPNHYIRFGVAETYHEFNTGAQQFKFKTGVAPEINKKVGSNFLYAHEGYIYIEDDWKITEKIKFNYGLHTSTFVVKNKVYP
ncbi:MAG: TonB-dependent receptor plug domain-containing protein, partial [Bacteroidia bacterium]|nr:TonB-dependent receptor plug domain-containing protein [Bacteroidia bacterium]